MTKAFLTCLFILVHCVGLSNAQSRPLDSNGKVAYKPDPILQKTANAIAQSPGFKNRTLAIQHFVDSFLQQASQKVALETKTIRGSMLDEHTGEGIPFGQIFFPHSSVGTTAELDGSFTISYRNAPSDTIIIKALGYKDQIRIVSKTDTQQHFEIEMSRTDNMLREFVVKAGEDPCIVLVKNIIKQKTKNNPDQYNNYKYELYNKLELDLVRMSKEQFAKIPMMKPFSFIFNNIDSFSEAKPFLPIFLTETISDYYFQRNPKKTKELLKGSQIKGINNESITQFLGGMYQQINLYDNFIDVFGKQFVSPVNNNALFYYNYQIKDTQYALGHRLILVQFVPKRSSENCFIGDFWVADSVFALQRISLDINPNANINLVNRVSLYQEFAPIGASIWFNVKDKFIADFSVPYGAKKMPGFIGRKTTSYKNIAVNDSMVSAYVNNKALKTDVLIEEGARQRDAAFWNQVRHDSLNKNERAIYSMIDTLNSLPIFKRTKNTLLFLAKGVQNIGPFELGPYWTFYNKNPIEGNRFRISIGTNQTLFKNLYLNGYLAYGTLDQRLKYKVAGLWIVHRHPRERIYVSYTSDLDRSISYYSEAATDNFLSTFVRKNGVPYKLAFVQDFRFEHYKEYYSGFSHELSLIHKDFKPNAPLPSLGIFENADGTTTDHVTNSEIGLKVRFAYKERFLEDNYHRVSLGSKYPIVSLRIGIGLKNVLQSAYAYQKINLTISDQIQVPHLGSISYNLFVGKHFGNLPYPLLEVHPGNDFYYYSPYTFSMMNRFEFLSDTYAGFMFEHNIGGGIFNYVPVLKKVKIRQFWTFKTAIGKLSKENQDLNLNKGFDFKTLASSPYIEIGTGVDNIFQLFRIDCVWRVAPTSIANEPLSKRFGIFGSFKVGF